MGGQGSPKSLLFILWNKRVSAPFIPVSHLSVKMDGPSPLVYESGCSAGEDAAFLLLSAQQAGWLYCLHPPHPPRLIPQPSPGHSMVNTNRLVMRGMHGPRSDSLGVLKSKGLRSAAAAASCDQISAALRAALIPGLFWRDETGRDS